MKRFIQYCAATVAVLLCAACTQQKQEVAPGIYPQPQLSFIERRIQVRLPQEKADVAFIFIGGFAEQLLANFRRVYESTPVLPVPGEHVRAYYAWDGARGCLPFHSTRLIREDINAFLKINPDVDFVFVGHSYGGSAVMDVVRQMDTHRGKIIAVTLDAVSCRDRSHPRERAEEVDYWVNVYCDPYRNIKDFAAYIGGPWRACEQADVNLCFSGKDRDSEGERFRHTRPKSLFTEKHADEGASAHELLLKACKQFKIGHEPRKK